MSEVIEKESSALAELPPKETALAVYSVEKGLEPYLAKIRAEIDAFKPDVSTDKGRKAVASIAHKVAKSKVALDNIGKDLVAELKEMPRKVDAERKRMRDTLDAWKDEVRQPLTEWEQAESSRVARLREGVDSIRNLTVDTDHLDAAALKCLLETAKKTVIDSQWQEFEVDAARAKDQAIAVIEMDLAAREKYEAEQAELAKLRAEAEARRIQNEKDRIAREAAEAATKAAEAKAKAERDAAAKREADAKAAAEHRELALKLAAEKAEKERLQAIQDAEREKAEAIARAEQEKQDAIKRQEQAVEAERQRQADEAARVAAETARREADKAHKGKINRAALAAFIKGGMHEDCAKQAVTLIAKGEVPNIKIYY
ncbi:hypothetical protein ACMHYO_14125 [Allopusillimonas ginsengisoli]|uniref:hypothetical protein n=1 Tax=Allopusillimonas ginsengisoli TaxID=453575 RepID=UPI0039C19CD0